MVESEWVAQYQTMDDEHWKPTHQCAEFAAGEKGGILHMISCIFTFIHS